MRAERAGRRPDDALGGELAALGAGTIEQGVEVSPAHAVGAAHAHGTQHAAVDPVADRLGGKVELLGDLRDGERLVGVVKTGRRKRKGSRNRDALELSDSAPALVCIGGSLA